jgi:peptidoglycan/xylan/chitin deacetylase (PgdA/CDA1 family)
VSRAALVIAALTLVGCSSGSSSGSRTPPAATTAARPSRAAAPKPRPKPRLVFPHERPVPILEYHVVGTPPPDAPFPELYVRRQAFAAQLRWLRRGGYHPVSLRRVYDYWKRGYALPPRPVVLSFDDGYREDFTNVRPLLLRYRWPAVLNLAVQNVLDRKLTLRQLLLMVRDGWEIDAHTMTHVDLTTVYGSQLRYQVAGSRRWIRQRLRVPVAFFCYPSGRYNATVLRAVRAAGFLGATTENQGEASPRDGFLTLDRLRVNGSDSLTAFAAKLG